MCEFQMNLLRVLNKSKSISGFVQLSAYYKMQRNWDDQIKLGQLTLKNRICMAALTRQRCDPLTGIPNELVAQYYSQRSGAGMILTQATAWNQRGQAFPGAACLYNKDHAQGWKKVVDSVHQNGSVIFLQIFNGGRATHQKLNRGLEVQAPSAIAVRQEIRGFTGLKYPVPKEMTIQDIQQVKKEYEESIKLAKTCQFDGIQLHGAHGYLIDNFLRSHTNRRTDNYGGSVENRCRFCLQLIDITTKYYSPQYVGIKISPASRLRDMFDEKPEQTFCYLLKELESRKVGFVEIRESSEDFPVEHNFNISAKDQMPNICKVLRPFYKGVIVANDSFTPESGLEKIRCGQADMISFGRLFVSNPDLAERIVKKQEVNKNWDRNTFFGYDHGQKGYTDYKRYDQ